MKVAIIFEEFELKRGGGEKSTCELARGLSKAGVDVTLVASRLDPVGLENESFDWHEVPVSGWSRFQRWLKFENAMADHISRNNYEVVHCMTPLSTADVYQPRGGSFLHNSKRRIESYNIPALRQLKRITAWANLARRARISSEKFLCRIEGGPLIASLSNYVADQFKTEYDLDDGRVHVIKNGIDTDAIKSEEAVSGGKELKEKFSGKDGEILYLFAAANLRLKGFDWLLRSAALALDMLGENSPGFRIIVAGNVNNRSYLKILQGSSLQDRIVFTGWTDQMPSFVQMCDAVVLPTYHDACSRLVLEGLAAGKPCITTSYNGASEFLGEDRYGIVVHRCDDTDSLASALARMADREYLSQMSGRIISDRLDEVVSIERHVGELMVLYQELLRKKQTG
jgi:UDP-glucose:(heptosyl)LPS alpha-1,3-glucosyltransferase